MQISDFLVDKDKKLLYLKKYKSFLTILTWKNYVLLTQYKNGCLAASDLFYNIYTIKFLFYFNYILYIPLHIISYTSHIKGAVHIKIVFPLFSRLTAKKDIISLGSYTKYFPTLARFILAGC